MDGVDIAVLSVGLAISCSVGIYFAYKDRRNASLDNYFLAGRSMNPIATGLSILVTYSSAASFISQPAESYLIGNEVLWIVITRVLIVIPVTIYLIPAYRRLNMRSSYEFLEMRYNKILRRAAAFSGVLTVLFLAGLAIYVAAATLEVVTDLSTNWSIALASGFGISYTSLGGMKAVIWTDVVQFCFMVAGMLTILIKAILHIGGFQNLFAAMERGERYTMARFDYGLIGRVSPLSRFLGSFGLAFLAYGVSQQTLQRYQSCKTTSGARCTVSSSINSLAIVIVEDCFCLFSLRLRNTESLKVAVGKLTVVLMGLLAMSVAYVVSSSRSNISQLLNSVAGITTGPVSGLYILGFFFPKANSKGGTIGFCVSTIFGIFLFVGNEFFKITYQSTIPPRFTYGCTADNMSLTTTTPTSYYDTFQATTESNSEHSALQDLFNLNFNLFVTIGITLTVVVGYLASLVTGPQDPALCHPKLFIPIIDNKYASESVRRFFRFGVLEDGAWADKEGISTGKIEDIYYIEEKL